MGSIAGATVPGQGVPGSNGNEEVLHIPQSSRIGTSHSDDIMSYTGPSLRSITSLHRCSRRIL